MIPTKPLPIFKFHLVMNLFRKYLKCFNYRKFHFDYNLGALGCYYTNLGLIFGSAYQGFASKLPNFSNSLL